MNHHRILVILACVAATCAGCDRAWEAYQQIELGQPIPADSLLMVEGERIDDVQAWGEVDVVPFPAIVGVLGVGAKLDEQGRVVAKLYGADALGHWTICQTAARRWTMEVEVPAEVYRDPPPEGLSAAWAAPELSETATNALEYLMLVQRYCAKRTEQRGGDAPEVEVFPRGAFFSLVMYLSGRDAASLTSLTDQAPHLAGMTRDGFDWTYHDPYGGRVRIRNLGNRRFRIEGKYFGLFDPLMLIPLLENMMQEDSGPRFDSSVPGSDEGYDDYLESDVILDDAPFPPGPPELPDGDDYDTYDDYDGYDNYDDP